MRAMSDSESGKEDAEFDEFAEFHKDIDAAEKKVAGEIDPGARAMVVAVLVFALLLTFVLPHTGHARGFDVLVNGAIADQEAVRVPSRIFVWLAMIFGVGFSMVALLTRRWVLSWIALAGSFVASVIGMLAIWTRQTAGSGHPGPGIGLVIAWIAVILLTFHWARVVWSRTAVQLAAEQERREAAKRDQRTILDDAFEDDEGSDK
ncbi:putative conserved transmembrane protein [Mycobacteroides abscessus subsp. bolletii 1S-154-0310]|nr:putative conserved transmembrane protein [Mycobacteroides abscessus subsp. bolletii 1S-152-0914]EIU80905.1 putative conserved transmembrane protein [Mycobacteroides abscessus subsp. bolletii 1S-154-0310]EIU83679.1 putative conserved transmembrane protein [Mycobacteroides abscessus subsp. bolletii 2B-0626]EIV12109.1 putative conserved transmembrane protein [Mycobacteroides abscessus subsp. bolletii 2B-0912-R]EIV20165.1 putative conserved transmembrane protein [Mycobacteroides abscessus subsp.